MRPPRSKTFKVSMIDPRTTVEKTTEKTPGAPVALIDKRMLKLRTDTSGPHKSQSTDTSLVET